MSGISKRVSGSWVSGDYGIMKTATDTITTLPADIYANTATATVGLKGQTAQSGTPSPQNPVMPNGCGNKTGNLFDNSATTLNAYPTGGVIAASATARTTFCKCSPNTTYTVSKKVSSRFSVSYAKELPDIGVAYYDVITSHTATSITITTGAEAAYLVIFYYNVNYDTTPENEIKSSIMVNIGSQPLPYDPYGVKIPISSANTTTPVYLGEVQSTRRIKKLVLTGEENITQHSVQNDIIGFRIPTPSSVLGASIVICSHYKGVLWPVYNGYRRYGIVASNPSSGNAIVYMSAPDSEHNTLSTFVQWIKDQYTAGTPVTVWYVLATPTTGIVNEPLQKIGDYADELSNISIPVTAGGDTISVGTTVQPSEITANYHGWHNGAVKGYENGDWQPQVQALSLSNAPMLSNSLMAFPDMSEPEIEPETTE